MGARSNRPNVFAGTCLQRAAELRNDEAWLASARRSPAARFVPVCGDFTLVSAADEPRALLLDFATLAALVGEPERAVFLGLLDDAPCFGVDVEDALAGALATLGRLENIRRHATRVPTADAGLLAYARAMALWHRTHRYCAACGAPSRETSGGHLRVCENPDCGAHQFPRMDPAIIVLVSHGDRALLGRQPSWPAGVYSTIAGFVEPGESLEDAVVREVAEETGVQVGAVRYHSSQPWPFPSSLMLGFTAEALSTEIRLHDEELEDARWFTREEIAERVIAGARAIPAELSIAFRLVAHWYDRGRPGELAAHIAAGRKQRG